MVAKSGSRRKNCLDGHTTMKLRRLLFLFIALITSTLNFGCSVFKEKNISVIKHAGLDATNVIVDLIEPNELIAFNYEGDNLLVDWGDGYVDNLAVHVYDTALKTVTIQIFGDITSISFVMKMAFLIVAITITPTRLRLLIALLISHRAPLF